MPDVPLDPKDPYKPITVLIPNQGATFTAHGAWSPWDAPPALHYYGPKGDTDTNQMINGHRRSCVVVHTGPCNQAGLPTGEITGAKQYDGPVLINSPGEWVAVFAGMNDDYHADNVNDPNAPMTLSWG
jgi:hypothetical protein